MKISRSPRLTDRWEVTDSKKPADYAKWWAPGKPIEFDGTIDKTGKRHTDLRLEIDEDHILALFNALVERYRELRKSQEEAG